jgi:NAD(P)-dependent dehydrogenase (short-subunit alcohol dehydrogenase family)
MSLSGKVVIVTGAFGALRQAVTACMIAHGAKLALVDKQPGPSVEHRAGALLYTGVDLSQKELAGPKILSTIASL